MSLIGDAKLQILLKLREEPSHGYALADKLGISSGYIYQHLEELQEAAMIEVEESETEGRQRTFYRLTENGELLLEALGE
jgi:DNA-binding PadR family transcriptional regulator